MCSGGKGINYAEQTRLANIANIKAQQKAKREQVNVVMGGDTDEYRLTTKTGSKAVGITSEDMDKSKMSDLFSGNKGKGAIATSKQAANALKQKKINDYHKNVGLA